MPVYCVKCKSDGITKRAMYGPEGKKPTHCAEHGKKEDGYIDVATKRCEDAGCKERATHGEEGTMVRTHCPKHGKALNYINVINKRCEEAECKKQPNFGDPVEKKKKYCVDHKLPGMIDVASKRCEHVGCITRASYGDPVEKKLKFCDDHKLVGMIDVVNKRCEHPGCKTFATFGDPVEKTKRFCDDHKLADMINVVSKRCEHPGCKTGANFGDPVEKKRKFCADHKLTNMIDVVSKRCEHVGCKTIANFGDPVEKKKKFCVDHKLAGMIDVANKRCEHVGCITQASYGIVKNQPTHCADHKDDKMSDVKHNQCASCKLTIVKWKTDYCAVCDEFDKNDGASRKTRSKERAVIRALLENDIPNVDYIRVYDVKYNKSIGKACGSYRPDILIDCGNFMIIIEVDEFQHRPRYVTNITREIDDDGIERHTKRARVVSKYEGSCELTRMINIRFACGVPCYVIRFNPDPFKINGVPGRVSIETRHAELCRQVKSMMMKPPRSDLVVTYMYYDDALLATEDVTLPPGYVWTI